MEIFDKFKSLMFKSTPLEDIGFDDEDDAFNPRRSDGERSRSAQAFLEAYNENSLLRTPVHCIAEDLSCVDWYAERVDDKGRGIKFDRFTARGEKEKALCDLIERPHPRLSMKQLMYLIVVYLEMAGLAPLRMMKGRSGVGRGEIPDSLQPISPHLIKETPGPGQDYWLINFPVPDLKGGVKWDARKVPAHQMLSIYRPRATEPLGDWAAAAQSVDDEVSLAEAQSKWSLRTWLHGTFLGNIIALPNLGSRKEEITRNWRAKYSGYLNAGKDYFVDSRDADKVQVLPLSKDPSEMSLVDQRVHTRDVLGQAWQVPPERMGIISDANRSTIDVADFHQQSKNVLPRCKEIRAELNWRLARKFGDNLRIEFKDPVKESEVDKQLRIKNATSGGLMKINEARAEMGYEILDPHIGDRLMIPINNIALIGEDGSRLLAEQVEPSPGQDDIDEAAVKEAKAKEKEATDEKDDKVKDPNPEKKRLKRLLLTIKRQREKSGN